MHWSSRVRVCLQLMQNIYKVSSPPGNQWFTGPTRWGTVQWGHGASAVGLSAMGPWGTVNGDSAVRHSAMEPWGERGGAHCNGAMGPARRGTVQWGHGAQFMGTARWGTVQWCQGANAVSHSAMGPWGQRGGAQSNRDVGGNQWQLNFGRPLPK